MTDEERRRRAREAYRRRRTLAGLSPRQAMTKEEARARHRDQSKRSYAKLRALRGFKPRQRMSNEERRERQRQANKRYWDKHRDDADFQARMRASAARSRAKLTEEQQESRRIKRKAWRIVNAKRNRETIRRWEMENAERLKAARRAWYEAHRNEVIERAKRTKELETAAMQFLRERGLLGPYRHEAKWLRRSTAVAYVRQIGIMP